MFSVALIAAPPAFIAGWLLGKSVLCRSVAQPVGLSGPAEPLQQPVAESGAAPADTESAANDRHSALHKEIVMLREALAERDHQLRQLRQSLKDRPVPPEDTPGTARATMRKSLEQLQARLAAREQRILDLKSEIELEGQKSRRRVQRLLVWRGKYRSQLKQLRQQRLILNELREELRQRDLLQQEKAAAMARAQPSSDAPRAPATTTAVSVPQARPVSETAAAGEAPAVTTEADLDADTDLVCDLPDDEREDLQTLRGIGPAMHRRLNENGVYRLRQLALMSLADLQQLAAALGVGANQLTRHNWPRQACRLLRRPDLPAAQAGQTPVREADVSR